MRGQAVSQVVKRKDLEVDRRTVIQNATLAIRDVYDAIVELVTNADDRYQVLGISGRIEIEVEERRGGTPSILRVRDFADGMTSHDMETKLSRMGGRVSGMEGGLAVRGTNSRGAKDVAALGLVIFESIGSDGRFHRCRITPSMVFELDRSTEADDDVRRRLGIRSGTGTVVTIEVASRHRIPRHETLVQQASSLVRLRDILRDPAREVVIRRSPNREDVVSSPALQGTKRVSQRFDVPGYPSAQAKLVIYRSAIRFQRDKDRFRLGGILVKSRHAIHEASLFDAGLESDSCAHWFYGRLTCEAIDELWNEFDERYSSGQEPHEHNPVPILDPSRKSGLTRDHPFVAALYGEALKRLRPLVEEERKREQNQRSKIETRQTRTRLDALENAANQFMREWSDEDEEEHPRDGETKAQGRRFQALGFMVSPPFTQLIVEHSRTFSLNVLQASFPEIETGATVQLEPLSSDIELGERFMPLEQHPTRDGVLHASWAVKGIRATPATGLRIRVGPIATDCVIEVLGSEADRYADVDQLRFSRQRYRVRTDKGRKRIRVLAPLALADQFGFAVRIDLSNDSFAVSGNTDLERRESLGVAIGDFSIKASRTNPARANITATLGGTQASAEIVPVDPPGVGIHIRLEDVDHGSMRYRWKQNDLEIAARHPSLARYLGPKSEGFPGQEDRHFRVLLAEIVADAVCSELLRRNIEANPIDYENADWDLYYAEFSEYMTSFLPIAHGLVVPEV